MALPAINGFGHVDLTVSDVRRSVRWWEEVLGFTLINTREADEHTVMNVIHPCGFFIGLVEHANPSSQRFDERAVGLDHLALRVPDRAALEAWALHLDQHGVPHSGVLEEQGGPVLVFRDPDNIQLELWAFDEALIRRGFNATPMSQAPEGGTHGR